MRKSAQFVVAAVFLTLGSSSIAGVTLYTTQASYLAAISAPGVDTFNDLDQVQLAQSINRMAGSYTYTASSFAGGVPGSALYGAGTPGDAWLSTTDNVDIISFDNFGPDIVGVGGFFFSSDFAGQFLQSAEGINVVVVDGSGPVAFNLASSSAPTFFGFVSDTAISSFALGSADPGGAETIPNWPTVNDLTLGVAIPGVPPVPEPSTWAMMIAGLGVVGAAMRRRATAVNFA